MCMMLKWGWSCFIIAVFNWTRRPGGDGGGVRAAEGTHMLLEQVDEGDMSGVTASHSY